MSDLGFDDMIKVTFAPTITNLGGPTVAQLTAGVPLEGRLTPDGLATPADTARVPTSKLNSTFNTSRAGRRTFDGLMVKYVRGTEAAAVDVEEALVYGAEGYLCVRRDLISSAPWAAGQKVEVYPVQVLQPNPDSPAPDTDQAVEVQFAMRQDPKAYADPATVVA